MSGIDTHQIRQWQSIVTLIVFVLTNLAVLFPFHIPIYVPRRLWTACKHVLERAHIITNRPEAESTSRFEKLNFPCNFVTVPLIADLFLLAILAIGRREVHDGTVGADGIAPISIMVFFFSLAYIALSLDASGLIRYLAFKVLQRGGKKGYKLYVYLFLLFFGLAVLVGNDPVVLSGTAFLAYMTRAARNIDNPRAWIYAQFAAANVGSAIFVSSNPTNLVLAGAFSIKFVEYTVNMIVPVIVTVLILCPTLFVIFHDRKHSLIPPGLEMDELSDEDKGKAPINPNIPFARESMTQYGTGQQLPLEEILNPYLDRKGAAFGSVLIITALVVILVLNALTSVKHEHPVFWVTLPAAVVMFTWDLISGWRSRHATRAAADNYKRQAASQVLNDSQASEKQDDLETNNRNHDVAKRGADTTTTDLSKIDTIGRQGQDPGKHEPVSNDVPARRTSVESRLREGWAWARITFPTATVVLSHLPYALLPFSLTMFVLVQALVARGWVDVLAVGWDHWIVSTGTVGAVGGMGFVSVLLCNFAGTNIGTTILLCRVLQTWVQTHHDSGQAISQRTFWASVYGLALGVNYGAFSTHVSASLAGLLWRDILSRKHIHVSNLQFARYNAPIIAVAMAVGCAVLIGEVYITRSQADYTG